MRAVTLATVLVAFGVAGCGAELSDASEDTAGAINAKHLRYEQVDITAGPANVDGWFPVGLSDHGEVIGRFDWAVSVPATIETMRNAAVGRNRRRMRTPSVRAAVYPRSRRRYVRLTRTIRTINVVHD